MTNVKITPAWYTPKAREACRSRVAISADIAERRGGRMTPAEEWYAIRSTPLTPKGRNQ